MRVFPAITSRPDWTAPWANLTVAERRQLRLFVIRVLIATNLILGTFYIQWRYLASINWAAWPFAILLLLAETSSYLDAWLFGIMMWRLTWRDPPPPLRDATVDVFITTYNEDEELVATTARAALGINHPVSVWILDDGNRPAMRAVAEFLGCGYVTRSTDWIGQNRHAKAGNVNNALMQTSGEFILILDADQIPAPQILDRVLGYFRDPEVALVQTTQYFYNVPEIDPFGSQAPLFYGPIQQGKDGWNAAFFCGSNAVLRREALLRLGITRYVGELERRIGDTLAKAENLLKKAAATLPPDRRSRRPGQPAWGLEQIQRAIETARQSHKNRASLQEITWQFQSRVTEIAQILVACELGLVHQDQADRLEMADSPPEEVAQLNFSPTALRDLLSVGAIAEVLDLIRTLDVDRADEAQPLMPLATISVTEDMATCMRLHGLGWKSVFHNEILCLGLAPEDLRTALQQRLRWAQGTIQVLLRENPLLQRGLSIGQRLMYLGSMWSYFSGFSTAIYLAGPPLFLLFGIMPVRAYSDAFFWHLVPFLLVNQLLFTIVGWRLKTWRGQQYSLALFPLWIRAVITAVRNVYFGKGLGFVVTPKVRQGGVYFGLVRPQLFVMAITAGAILYGLARLAFGFVDDGVPILVNSFWGGYNLVMLSVVIEAAMYEPESGTEYQADFSQIDRVSGGQR